MSVPKSERSLSLTEYFHNALELRKDMTFMLLRDFGVKDKVRELDYFCAQQRMSDEDKEKFRDLLGKYNLGTRLTEVYPKWFLDTERDYIFEVLRNMISNITTAHSIFITTDAEYERRRMHFNYATADCNRLLQEMQYLMFVLPVNANKLMPYVERIRREIELLKWARKRDNKTIRHVHEREESGEGTVGTNGNG